MNTSNSKLKSVFCAVAVVMSCSSLLAAYTVPMWNQQIVPAEKSITGKSINGINSPLLLGTNTQSDAAELVSVIDAQPAQELGVDKRSQRVRLDTEGYLNGKVSLITSETGDLRGVPNGRILIIRNGVIIKEVRTDNTGNFRASGLAPQQYSLFLVSKAGFSAYSVDIAPALAANLDADSSEEFVSLQANEGVLSLSTAAIPPVDFAPLKEIIRQYLPRVSSGMNRTEGLDNTEEAPIPELTTPTKPNDLVVPPIPELTTPTNINGPVVPEDDGSVKLDDVSQPDADVITRPDVSLNHNSIMLTEANELRGRVKRFHPTTGRQIRLRRMQAFLLRQGEVIAKTQIQENGQFVFRNVRPGAHSFVAAGLDGFNAFGVHTVAHTSNQLASLNVNTELVVNMVALQGGGGGSTLVSPEDAETGNNEFEDENPDDNDNEQGEGDAPPQPPQPPQPPNPPGDAPGGGGAGGGNSGGGGTGGGTGTGDALLPALLGFGGGILLNEALDDNNENQS